MKKTTLLSTLAFAFVMLLTTTVSAQKFSKLDKSPLDVTFYRTDRSKPAFVKVVYSRPFLKGRELSKLAPNGEVWRTGANEAADITIYKDMKIGGKSIAAGTYSLFTIPGEKEWTIILSNDVNTWGAYTYKEANDVLRITAPVSKDDSSLENFSITFESNDAGADMYLGWGTTRVAVPFMN
ncbi:DUF2911 domain-containing protein [Algibacter pectinivorans]|uniref:DUF2911 domain-containing protein n=1 Tax=Algibacter pectinivorans TaxID=870482 RepID=A0A1I1M7H9_9FLAO|nr:DUF2911 domain-containing protein [Algibacter pectinivorans]SFC81359.1 Protein of unknown function [Algibacter pectinivorans]